MRQRNALGLLCLVTLSQGCTPFVHARERAVTLVREGQPAAQIVLAKEPTRAAQLAAFELQHHVRLITGATLPIVGDDAEGEGARILVGESAATRALGLENADFTPQDYLVRFEPDAVVLMGRDKDDREKVKYDEADPFRFGTWPDLFDEQGTCYAVYDFLERCCGVRWFAPHEFGTVVPETKTLTVKGAQTRRSPAFSYRDIGWPMGMSEVYNMVSSLWPSKSPAIDEIDAIGYPALKKQFPNRWHYIHAKRGVNRLFLQRHRLGGQPYRANHSFYGYYERFWEKTPKAEEHFVEKRPAYFAKGYEGLPPQMCFTDDGFIRQVVQDARDYFDGKGAKSRAVAFGDFFALVPQDNSSYCKCPRCQALMNQDEADNPFFSNGYASDYVFGFANQVARQIRESHPGKYLATLAYARYAYYPRQVRLESNIAVQLCLHVRNIHDEAIQANDVKFFDSWVTKEKDRPIYLWLYYCFPAEIGHNGQWHCFPGFFAHGIDRWFKRFHKHGVRGAFFNGWGQDVEAYVTLKLLDDPTRAVDAILDDYFAGYYGAAAEPMKQLYLAIEEAYSNPVNYPKGFSGHQQKKIAWEHLGTEERMTQFAALFQRAQAAAKTDRERQRLALFGKEVWDYMVEGRRKYFARSQAPTAKARVVRLPAPDGDPRKVDWSKAAPLDTWSRREGGAADRKLEARLAHDGTHLYLRLVESEDPKPLVSEGIVWSSDDWEIFVARQRGRPYRQLGVNPKGNTEALAYGEPTPTWDSGATVHSDVSAPGRWTTCVTLPLSKLVPGGAKPGDRLYLNLVRVMAVSRGRQVYVWSPESNVHEPDRFGEITLE